MAIHDHNDTQSEMTAEMESPELMSLQNENLALESEIEMLQA